MSFEISKILELMYKDMCVCLLYSNSYFELVFV